MSTLCVAIGATRDALPFAGPFPRVPRPTATVDWPAHERPREKLFTHGPAALSDAEPLATFLRVGMPGKSAVGLAQELLTHFGSLAWLRHASQQEFSSINGIGPAKYAQLHALLEVARHAPKENSTHGQTFDSP